MAKFGEKKDEYSPFSDISSTLAALSEPVPESKPESKGSLDAANSEGQPLKLSRAESNPPKRGQHDAENSGGGQTAALDRVRPESTHQPKVSAASALTTVKRFKTTRAEAIRIDRATVNLAAQLGVRMDTSKLTRALWEIYLTHEQEILRSVQHAEGLTERPPNTDAVALAEFDEKLAELIGEGLMMACMRSRRQ